MNPTGPGVVSIDPATLKARLESGEPLTLLDVREPYERDLASIPAPATARILAIPMGEVSSRFVEIAEAARAGPVVVYCHHGQRSMVVARWLDGRGLAGMINLDGGIDAWTVRVDPSTPRY